LRRLAQQAALGRTLTVLRALRIRNVAIVDDLALDFAAGMNVLTGETGAGKSIITNAIGLLCGERAYTDLIRTDATEAEVEGVFDLEGCDAEVLSNCGVTDTDELLIRRVINRSGKGKILLNGSVTTATLLAQLGAHLIRVYGQHEQTTLLKSENHLELLDDFGALKEERAAMASTYEEFRAAAERLAQLTASGEAARQRIELLRFQSMELGAAKLEAGEEASLQQEREVQRHAEKLSQICQQGEEALYSSDDAVATALARVATQIDDAARVDASFREQADLLRQARAQVEEVAHTLRRSGERIQHDPERLAEIEERLALLSRLKRKYDCEAEALVDKCEAITAELADLEGSSADTATLKQEVRERATRAWTAARELSKARQAAARKLEKRMEGELHTLGMLGGVFRVVFTVSGSDSPQAGWADANAPGGSRLSASGADTVEFYLSANPGETPKPLARIASGGELSRIMLALKTLTAGAGEAATLIFDEVDTGIGGTVAEAVGKRLHLLARGHQILCITHLPQIAALADHHFAVEKRVAKGRTTTTAKQMEGDDRVRELARMLGGSGSVESERYARRLMAGAGPSK
ncbi:MAG TPA: DNA repair protein RecN, partial [Candidatus Acidoferrales bacterium]|nr:DNA repair protein RecN [Candidatus Acidoferrales bacterium]